MFFRALRRASCARAWPEERHSPESCRAVGDLPWHRAGSHPEAGRPERCLEENRSACRNAHSDRVGVPRRRPEKRCTYLPKLHEMARFMSNLKQDLGTVKRRLRNRGAMVPSRDKSTGSKRWSCRYMDALVSSCSALGCCQSRSQVVSSCVKLEPEPHCVKRSRYSTISAISSAVCRTRIGEPCLSRPPRICIAQPGQSSAASGAPVASRFASLRARMGAEISGSFSE